ncbi:MAG: hypothetical protein KDJ15_05270 [Alphaproteobacteria bacterium]|nr:hypothetical protein [Alphaproteobacteria bacterium]
MRKCLPLFGLAVLCAAVLFATPARASEPKLIGTYGDWAAYTFDEDGQKVCYMASQPKKAEGSYSRRGDVFALITHRPAEGSKNVFSYITGYTYKSGSDATVKIDSSRFTLFTQDETAWAPDAETDDKLAHTIRKGSGMVVTGTSSRGTETKDTFSLKGSGAAHDAINKACGMK